jgi:SAM-dependent methyltransferase
MKLNFGCGSQVIDGWVNVDYALGARLAKSPFFRILNKKIKLFDLNWDNRIYIHNLTKVFPWEDNSADIVYSSHTLEHLSRGQGLKFLSECHRVLRKGGIIRIVVPDLAHLVREYSEGRLRADEFVEKLGVLYKHSENPIKNRLLPFIQFPHKCMYDSVALLTILRDIGFNVRNREPFDSDIEDIKLIELEGRTQNAVIVEGSK